MSFLCICSDENRSQEVERPKLNFSLPDFLRMIMVSFLQPEINTVPSECQCEACLFLYWICVGCILMTGSEDESRINKVKFHECHWEH